MSRETRIDAEINIQRYPESGYDPEPTTLCAEFKKASREWASYPAVVDKDGKMYTYGEYYENAERFAKSLIHMGVQPRDVCSMIGFNSPEYFFAIHGTWLAGCVTSGIYTTNNPEACSYVLNHSEAKVCLCQGGRNAVKIASIADQVPSLKAIVVYWPDEGMPTNDQQPQQKKGVKIYTWDEFLDIGKATDSSEVEKRLMITKPGHCASLIYTSGTTGTAKGVMLSHDSCCFNARSIPPYLLCTDDNRWVSFLPLNHIAAQFADVMIPALVRITMYLARPDALRGSLVPTLRKVRPTFFVGVPRVYEKFVEAIRGSNSTAGFVKSYVIAFCEYIGQKACLTRQFNQQLYLPYGYSLANYLAFSTIKEKLGLDQARILVVSAAPITDDTLNFFSCYDMPIYDLLGQSEGTAPICMNSCLGQMWKKGSAGKALPGIQVKLDPVTSELLYRGRNVMMGYLKQEQETKNTIDDEGWLHSGDQASIDADGFVTVTGRLKELIVTAGGENISPVPIENKILELCPIIANCVVVGDKRKFLSCLLSLKTDTDPTTGEPLPTLTASVRKQLESLGSQAKTVAEAREDSIVIRMVEDAVKWYNDLSSVSRAENIRKWFIIERDFSIGSGELTATMKMKRNVVTANYSKEIESMYQMDAVANSKMS